MAARRFQVTDSELIRRAIEHKLPAWERTGKLIIVAKKQQSDKPVKPEEGG